MIPEVFFMIKNSILYHRLWYVKKRNAKRIHIYFRLLLILIIFATLIYYANKNLLPCLNAICEYRTKSIITDTVSKAIDEVFAGNATYEDFVIVNRDKSGRINSIETNVTKLNKLSARVSSSICSRLSLLERQKVSIPFGALLGNSVFSGMGPDLNIVIRPEGNIETSIKSEFHTAGINQTRHVIYLQVHAQASVVTPLTRRKTEIVSSIPVAETVIVGTVPEVYLH